MKINQFGRSMVEMLGVLAIIGVLSVGAIAGYQKAMFKYKVNKFMDQMTNIIANIRTAYGTQKATTGLNNENIKKMGLVPTEMYKTANTYYPQHFWDGEIAFGAACNEVSVTNGPPKVTCYDDMFYISAAKLPKDVCVTILTSDWGTSLLGMGTFDRGGDPHPYANVLSSASENYGKQGDENYPIPFSLTRAENTCAETNGKSKAVYFYFKL